VEKVGQARGEEQHFWEEYKKGDVLRNEAMKSAIESFSLKQGARNGTWLEHV
jgi:hypothetical protein